MSAAPTFRSRRGIHWMAAASLCAAVLAGGCGGGGGGGVASDNSTASAITPAIDCARATDSSTARPAGWATASHDKSAAPDYGVVFPSASVRRMDITISACEWQAVLANLASLTGVAIAAARGNLGPIPGVGCTGNNVQTDGEYLAGTPLWVPVTVAVDGTTWRHVGMRLKGSSSLLQSWNAGLLKLPFRLHFDKFDGDFPAVGGQRFYGFQKLSFTNNAIDRSFMREKLTADLLREHGVLAARTGWVRVYVDYGAGSQYFGLYTMTEVPAKPMLQAQFGSNSGNLYKPAGEGAEWGPRTQVSDATFTTSFEKETNASAQDWSDVRNAVDALHAPTRTSDVAAWRAGLERNFNVDGFLKWMGANAVLGNGDSYGFIAHNYYLYANPLDPAPGRLNWIPWDHDRALSCAALDVTYPASGYPANRWPLMRYLLEDPVYRATYLQHAGAFLASSQFSQVDLTARLDAAYALIQPYVTGPEGEQVGSRFSALDSAAQFDSAQAALRTLIDRRRAQVPAMLR